MYFNDAVTPYMTTDLTTFEILEVEAGVYPLFIITRDTDGRTSVGSGVVNIVVPFPLNPPSGITYTVKP